jgi:hypothetical protein
VFKSVSGAEAKRHDTALTPAEPPGSVIAVGGAQTPTVVSATGGTTSRMRRNMMPVSVGDVGGLAAAVNAIRTTRVTPGVPRIVTLPATFVPVMSPAAKALGKT